VSSGGGTRTEIRERQHFLAAVAMAVGALSALAIAFMWIPTWAIAPCST
jgi:hypothetical protein